MTKVVLPVPEAPQTIKQNWIPFLTFFLRRSLMWEVEVDMLAVLANEFERQEAILKAVLGVVAGALEVVVSWEGWYQYGLNVDVEVAVDVASR